MLRLLRLFLEKQCKKLMITLNILNVLIWEFLLFMYWYTLFDLLKFIFKGHVPGQICAMPIQLHCNMYDKYVLPEAKKQLLLTRLCILISS